MKNELYETVIGLEVHVELKTETKLFCSCRNNFGDEPNTNICPTCLGMPGTLPLLNGKAVEYAVKAGLALGCEIHLSSAFDRKNYKYPDLPKAYQITQYFSPVATGGRLEIITENGSKNIGITRIHIEEDAGKLIHDAGKYTLIDYNRAGVPLIEIVSEPDINSGSEAVTYLKKLRSTMLCLKVSDCKMNEGSMRADVNVSVRKKGEKEFGTRTEIKNVNSFNFIAKAIEYERKRQIEILENGGKITKETMRYDPAKDMTFPMRSKEDESDYRYFPEPDIPPLVLSGEYVKKIGNSLPELPDGRIKRLCGIYSLPSSDAAAISESDALYFFYLECADLTPHYKTLANLLLSEFKRTISPEAEKTDISPLHFASIVSLFGDNKINSAVAKKLVNKLCAEDYDPLSYAESEGLLMITDENELIRTADAAIGENPAIVSDYLCGKTAAAKSLMGICMKKTGGKADPVRLSKILENLLTERKSGK